VKRKLGFSRKIRLSHLDFAFGHILVDGIIGEEELDPILAPDILGANRRKKANDEIHELFMTPSTCQLVARAVALYRGQQPSDGDRLAVYWSLFLVAFPFVRDGWAVIGQLSRLAPQFTSQSFGQRLGDLYGGGRTTVLSTQEVLGMMRDWGVVAMDKPGLYHLSPKRAISTDAQCLLLMAMCLTQEPPVYPLQRFPDEPSLFPFRLRLSVTDLRHKESWLRVSIQGDRDVLIEARDAFVPHDP
jgi:hypothetical protein